MASVKLSAHNETSTVAHNLPTDQNNPQRIRATGVSGRVGEESRVFILDEPELHLHPHSQRLLEELLKASSSRNQLILATHSPHFVNFHVLDGILLIRESSGRSVPVKLPEGYLSDEELAKASKLVWSEDKEFLFSKRVLLVEGETEYGAIPVLARKMGKDFDKNGVTVVSVGGHHFGLFMKILRGFGFPFQVVCDSDVLMRVDARIRHGAHIVKASTLFEAAEQAGMLGEDEGRILSEYQSKTYRRAVGKDEQEFYDDEILKPLVALANKLVRTAWAVLQRNTRYDGRLLAKA